MEPIHTEKVEVSSSGSSLELANRLAEEMAQRWAIGENPTADDYFVAFPDIRTDVQSAIRLIHEEVCQRQERGDPLKTEEVLSRYPQWRAELEIVLGCHQLLYDEAEAMPQVGDRILDYRLLAELGRGGQGTVFIAEQIHLAHRLVVLKITERTGQEHKSLARLQHTGIVPLLTAHEDSSRSLRILCMPWFGGQTLEDIQTRVLNIPFSERTALDFTRDLDQPIDGIPPPSPETFSARRWLESLSYADAVVWIGACLADALQHAHERGLVHLDIKPSNILLAADGQPMLLDFHLAQPPLEPDGRIPNWLGGTLHYMSPEQSIALQCVKDHSPLNVPVDGRADIYSLGLCLYEILGGDVVLQSAGLSKLARMNPCVSPGLSDIIDKCTQKRPEARYQQAGELADDLRRHLHHLPLMGVRNRSLRERWSKWRNRSPRALPKIFQFLALLLALIGSVLFAFSQSKARSQLARQALAEGQDHAEAGRQAEAIRAFDRSIQFATGWLGSDEILHQAERSRAEAVRQHEREKLHRLVEKFRGRLGIQQAERMTDQLRLAWERRPESGNREDLLDLGLIFAEALLSSAPREALQVLDQIETMQGRPSRVVCLLRERGAHLLDDHALARKEAQRGKRCELQTAWERVAYARALIQRERWNESVRLLDEAIELHPQSYWAHYYRGLAALHFKDNRAIQEFSICLALAPSTEAYFNRGLAWEMDQKPERAVKDYARALQLHPTFADACLNRAILLGRLKQPRLALAELTRARNLGAQAEIVHYNRALIYREENQIKEAQDELRQALGANPEHRPSLTLLKSLKKTR